MQQHAPAASPAVIGCSPARLGVIRLASASSPSPPSLPPPPPFHHHHHHSNTPDHPTTTAMDRGCSSSPPPFLLLPAPVAPRSRPTCMRTPVQKKKAHGNMPTSKSSPSPYTYTYTYTMLIDAFCSQGPEDRDRATCSMSPSSSRTTSAMRSSNHASSTATRARASYIHAIPMNQLTFPTQPSRTYLMEIVLASR